MTRNHLKRVTRFFKGVYRPHHEQALLVHDMLIPDVLRRRQVCIPTVAAGHTLELQTNTVTLSYMSTSRTGLRSIGGVYETCFDAFLGKLITCLELQRRIWPPANFFSKVLSLFQGCFPDIAKVFEYDHPSSDCIGVLSQGFRSNMHKMFRNGSLFVSKANKESPRRTSAYGLNFGSTKSNTFSQVIKSSTGKEKWCSVRGVRGNKHPLDAGIHSYNTSFGSWFRDIFLIAKNQVQFIFNFFKFRVLPVFRRNVRMMQENWVTPKSNPFCFANVKIPSPDQRYCGILKDGQFPAFIGLGGLIGCGDVLAYTASKLAGQLKFTPKNWIIGLGESVRVHLFGVEDYRREPVDCLDIIFDYIVGFSGAGDFYFSSSDSFHYYRPLFI